MTGGIRWRADRARWQVDAIVDGWRVRKSAPDRRSAERLLRELQGGDPPDDRGHTGNVRRVSLKATLLAYVATLRVRRARNTVRSAGFHAQALLDHFGSDFEPYQLGQVQLDPRSRLLRRCRATWRCTPSRRRAVRCLCADPLVLRRRNRRRASRSSHRERSGARRASPETRGECRARRRDLRRSSTRRRGSSTCSRRRDRLRASDRRSRARGPTPARARSPGGAGS